MELKQAIRDHYDKVSPYYLKLWGVHIHHGYWKDGSESKEKAQEQLIDELVERADIHTGVRLLDVGCGIGGTAIYLAKTLSADVVGITLSPNQVAMANALAKDYGVNASFLVMDGENITLEGQFDVVWTTEAISHYYNKQNFFSSAARLCKSGGIVVIADWLKEENLNAEEEEEFIQPIEHGMLLPGLCTMQQYIHYLGSL